MSIFPEDIGMDIVIAQTTQEDTELPLLKEYAWDFEKNDFINFNGKNIIVEGLEAIKIWIYKALKTKRYKYLAYTWDYGNELEDLIGQRTSKEFLQSECERNLKDCLLVNHYISALGNVNISTEGKKIVVEATVSTVYGEVNINV